MRVGVSASTGFVDGVSLIGGDPSLSFGKLVLSIFCFWMSDFLFDCVSLLAESVGFKRGTCPLMLLDLNESCVRDKFVFELKLSSDIAACDEMRAMFDMLLFPFHVELSLVSLKPTK